MAEVIRRAIAGRQKDFTDYAVDRQVRCPVCRHRLGDLTPSGQFCADIKCGRCNLQFIFELPLAILIYESSTVDLLVKRWGLMVSAQAAEEASRLVECYAYDRGLVDFRRIQHLAPCPSYAERNSSTYL